MKNFSFKELHFLLTSDEWFNTAPEVEVLKGKYEKISNYKDVYKKGIRKIKFKK